MTAMRVVFLGSDAWSVPSLDALVAAGHRIALVVTATPKPAGRGHRLTPTPVAARARALGLPLLETDDVRGGAERQAIAEAAPDVLVVVAFGQLLPADVLSVARIAPINLHFSLLPRHRGASPVRGALLEGDAETGVTTMRMVDELDAGPVYLRRSEPIRPADDAASLGDRLAAIGAEVLVETLAALGAAGPEPREQDPAGVTWTREIRSTDRDIDWSVDASAVVRLCRAMAPDPGALTRFRETALKVLRAEVLDPGEVVAAAADARPAGSVLAVDRAGIVVACGEGAVRILELVPAGRNRMPAVDFARGARIAAGELLGADPANVED